MLTSKISTDARTHAAETQRQFVYLFEFSVVVNKILRFVSCLFHLCFWLKQHGAHINLLNSLPAQNKPFT